MSAARLAAAATFCGAAALVALPNVREALAFLAKGARLTLLDVLTGEASRMPTTGIQVEAYLERKLGGTWSSQVLHDTGGQAARYISAQSDTGTKVFVKLSSASFVKRVVEAAIGLAPRELAFFNSILPTAGMADLGMLVPRCFVAEGSKFHSCFIIVLEDLNSRAGGVTVGKIGKPFALEEVRVAVRSLGSMHAKFWNRTKVIPPEFHAPEMAFFDLIKRLTLPMARRRGLVPEGSGVDRVCRAFERLRGLHAVVDRIDALSPAGLTLVHGDSHGGNLFFTAGSDGQRIAGLLDWQTYHVGNPLLDLCLMLISSLSPGDFAAHQQALAEDYLQSLLAANISGITWEHIAEIMPLAASIVVVSGAMVASLVSESDKEMAEMFAHMWPRMLQLVTDLNIAEHLEKIP